MYATHPSGAPAATPRDGERAMQQILARSATDRTFRQQLLTDPRAAVAAFGGKDVSAMPETFNVVFVEAKPGTATIVLPDAVDPAAELSEAELEGVAGGSWAACAASLLLIAAEIIDAIRPD